MTPSLAKNPISEHMRLWGNIRDQRQNILFLPYVATRSKTAHVVHTVSLAQCYSTEFLVNIFILSPPFYIYTLISHKF